MSQLDSNDRRILKLLQHNAKLTTKELAQELNLSTTPVYERVKRLELMGFIEKYVAVVNKEKLGKGLVVFCNVTLKEHSKDALERFQTNIAECKEVLECYSTAGHSDYLLKILTADMNSYHEFVMNKLSVIPNIANMHSSFALGEVKCSTAIDVD